VILQFALQVGGRTGPHSKLPNRKNESEDAY